MAFRVLNPELVQYLLRGERDELTPACEARIAQIKATPCPRCGASLHPKIRGDAPFAEGDPLPRMLASCECGFVLEPKSGLIIHRGSATKVEDPFPLIRPKD